MEKIVIYGIVLLHHFLNKKGISFFGVMAIMGACSSRIARRVSLGEERGRNE